MFLHGRLLRPHILFPFFSLLRYSSAPRLFLLFHRGLNVRLTRRLFWLRPWYNRHMYSRPDNEPTACAECGAPLIEGLTCWEQLGMVIAWEHNDTALLREHFLTVATYNIQHPAQFADGVLDGLRHDLREYLAGTITVEAIRRQTSRAFEGNARVLRPAVERVPMLRLWTTTIADVYLPAQPQGAAERVRAWGASALCDMESAGHDR